MDIPFFSPSRLARLARVAVAGLLGVLLVACGGDDDVPSSGFAASAPVITRQPVDVGVTAGQDAAFAVAVTGTAPLSFQWQRNGVDVAGATSAAYTLSAPTVGDSGAAFHVVVSNVAGSVTSRDAVLTVTAALPVLTLTQQPADASVVAGAAATFSVAATCSAGTLDVQWQRNSGTGGAFVAIAGATSATLAVTTSVADDAAQFRAALDCGGRAPTTSAAALLAVSAPTRIRVDPLALTGLRLQGTVNGAGPMAVNPDGSVTFANAFFLKRLSADLASVTKFAGSGNLSITDGQGAAASFSQIQGIAADGAGNLYVSDNSAIRRVANDGTVITVAGTAQSGAVDATGANARFGSPRGIAIGPDGDLYVADSTGQTIRRVTAAGVVTTYAGAGQSGYLEGAAGAAKFNSPWAVAVAGNGDVYVADRGNSRIRRIARNGNVAGAVTTFVGNGLAGNADDGVGGAALMEQPIAMTITGNTLTVLQGVGVVRQIDLTTAAVTTLAGTYTANPTGFIDGPRGKALLTGTGAIARLPDGRFIIGDNATVRVVAINGDVHTIAVKGSDQSFADEGGVLAQHPFDFASNSLQTLAVDAGGRVVVASAGEVRRIAADGSVSLVAGLSTSFMGMIDGPGAVAQFTSVGSSVAAAPDGTLVVSDSASLRRIDPAGNVTLLAGDRQLFLDPGNAVYFGAVDGDAATARFQSALKLAVGPDGALYVADTANNAIRRVDASGNTTTWAGAFGQSSLVDGPRATARFLSPRSIAFAPDGTLWIADGGALRKISADGTTVSTVVLSGAFAQVVVDGAGNLYLSEADGLYGMAAGTPAPVRLIAGGSNDAVVTGAAPHLGRIDSLAVLAPGQLVMISGDQFYTVTLP